MAIKIKSSDIFAIQNNKILDNAYKKINLYENNIANNIDYNSNVANVKTNVDDFETNTNNAKDDDLQTNVDPNSGYTKSVYSYVKSFYTTQTISIDRYQKDNFEQLIDLFDGTNDNSDPNIEYSVTWEKITGSLWGFNVPTNITTNLYSYFSFSPEEQVIDSGKIAVSNGNVVYSYTHPNLTTLTATAQVIDQSNNASATITLNNDKFNVNLTLLIGAINIGASTEYSNSTATTAEYHGIYEYYKPIKLTIGFKGDKQYYTTQDIPLSIGDGNKEFQLESNELNQDTAFGRKYHDDINVTISGDAFYDYTATIATALDYDLYIDVSFSNIQSMQIATHTFVITQGQTSSNPYSVGFISTNTIVKYVYQYLPLNSILLDRQLERYKNGIETMTLKCKVGDYYDIDGNKAISIENDSLPMLFQINDIVIPYMLKSSVTPYMQITDSMETPISISKDGTAKKFKVISTKLIFSGALWQEIVLQESK